MADDIASLRTLSLAGISTASDLRALDTLRVHLLGKSGALTGLLKELGRASPDIRRTRGAALNELRDELTAALDSRRAALEDSAINARLAAERMDISLPPLPEPPGSIHPISRTMEEIAAIFGAMGFAIAEGPGYRDPTGTISPRSTYPATIRRATITTPSTCRRGPAVTPPGCCAPTPVPVQIRTMLDAAAPDPRHHSRPHLPR